MDLAARVGALMAQPVRVLDPLQNRRHVSRAHFDDGTTAIVKTPKRWEGQTKFPPSGFWSDWAGCAFVSACAQGIGPRFLAGDADSHVYVIEDLGQGGSLADALLGGDASRARDVLRSLGTTLGSMHASTMGHEDRFDATCATLPSFSREWGPTFEFRESLERFRGFCSANHVPWTQTAETDAAGVARALEDPGRWRAYIHGDPCPDNCVVVGERVLVFDFEGARFGHALIDAVYARITFPTCWCVNRLPDDAIGEFERRYRAELVRACEVARDDDAFEREMVTVSAGWVVDSVAGLSTQIAERGDGPWGIATLGQRLVHRLDAFARMTERSEHLRALGDVCRSLRAVTSTVWPDAAALDQYPAFRA